MAKHGDLITDGGITWKIIDRRINGTIADSPCFYARSNLFEAPISTSASTITTPDKLLININNHGYITGSTVINLNSSNAWDSVDTTYATQNNRVGMDFYIYAVEQDGDTPKWVLSSNSTCPSNSDSIHSRKVGGFHCLCVDVGTISGHTLSGLKAGAIIPNSIWDLRHRPLSDPEGMVWVEGLGLWVDIYLNSWSETESKLVSTYGGIMAGGVGDLPWHIEKFVEEYGLIGKRLPSRDEFMVFAKGSNEGSSLGYTAAIFRQNMRHSGGRRDTNNRRMISNYGIEECCGASSNVTSTFWLDSSTTIKTVYNSKVDTQSYGGESQDLYRIISVSESGTTSTAAAHHGSRSISKLTSSNVGTTSSSQATYKSARGVSKPRVFEY